MRRPVDWSPLELSDPLPGDPDRIADEARRLRDMATEMRAQISRLHAISRDDTCTGQYAQTLRTAASDLAGQLQKAVGRYQRVAGELSGWAPELTHAQTESLRALEKAQAAEVTRKANTVIRATPHPGDPPPSPDEQARERRRHIALDDATHDLAAARRQLDDAIEHAKRMGRHYAGRIDDAIDDDVKDSRWDKIKNWIHHNAGWITTVAEVLGWVATALAVLALFFPGVDIIEFLAIGLTVGALFGHGALALSGDGSWADVALDAFALATFGTGRIATRGLKGVQQATREAGARTAGRMAQSAALRSSRAARSAAGRTLQRRTATAAQRRGARRLIDNAKGDASKAYSRAAHQVRDAPLAGPTRTEILRAGNDVDSARFYKDIDAIRGRFPGDADVAPASRHADALHNTRLGALVGASVADYGDKAGETSFEPYHEAKDYFTREWGSTW